MRRVLLLELCWIGYRLICLMRYTREMRCRRWDGRYDASDIGGIDSGGGRGKKRLGSAKLMNVSSSYYSPLTWLDGGARNKRNKQGKSNRQGGKPKKLQQKQQGAPNSSGQEGPLICWAPTDASQFAGRWFFFFSLGLGWAPPLNDERLRAVGILIATAQVCDDVVHSLQRAQEGSESGGLTKRLTLIRSVVT
ncbi:hypothetical protein CI102_12419 [Trichoderma harzianum]|nr:hypothetical protein CI102_12419 [Trichoderma harzianum]